MREENNKRAKCPICGRFCKQEAVDQYNGLLNERNRLAKELDAVSDELASIRKTLIEDQTHMGEAVKSAADYETLYINTRGKLDQACADVKRYEDKLAEAGTKLVSIQSECNELRAENERLYGRGLFARLLNKRV